jgi:hypothetical protein
MVTSIQGAKEVSDRPVVAFFSWGWWLCRLSLAPSRGYRRRHFGKVGRKHVDAVVATDREVAIARERNGALDQRARGDLELSKWENL